MNATIHLIKGYFINLARSPEHLKAIQADVLAWAGPYSRIPGVEGMALLPSHHGVSAGEVGCLLSHLAALQRGAVSGKHIHVLDHEAILFRSMPRHRGRRFARPCRLGSVGFLSCYRNHIGVICRIGFVTFTRQMAKQSPTTGAAIKDLITGCFVNLDRSPERRKAMQAELARAGLGGIYSRVPGIDGMSLSAGHHGVSAGELGCFLSHLRALEGGAASGKHIHVLEDDAILSRHFARHLGRIAAEVIAPFDIVFTDMLIPPTPPALEPFLRQMTAFMSTNAYTLIAGTYWGCMSSYIVNATSVGRLTTLLRQEVERGISLPVDVYVARLVAEGTIRVGCIFPFITALRFPYPNTRDTTGLASTVMRPGDTAARRIVFEASQAAFYVEADRRALLRALSVVSGRELEAERRALQVALMTLADAEKAMRRPRP